MRRIHRVAHHEKFVASGIYTRLDKHMRDTGAVEHWNIHEQPDGAQLIRVDVDGRAGDGRSILVEAWRSPSAEGGRIERFDMVGYGAAKDTAQVIRASYQIEADGDADSVLIGRTVNEQPRQQEHFPLPPEYVVEPNGTIFAGMGIAEASTLMSLKRLSAVTVVSSPLHFQPPSFDLFPPSLGEIVLNGIPTRETLIFGGRPVSARRYEWQNPAVPRFDAETQTGPQNIIWLDEYDVPLRCEMLWGHSTRILNQYSRRPEPIKR